MINFNVSEFLKRLAGIGRADVKLEIESNIIDIGIILSDDISPIISAIDAATAEIASRTLVPPLKIKRVIVATVRRWVIYGSTVQEVQIKLPAYVEGVMQSSRYDLLNW